MKSRIVQAVLLVVLFTLGVVVFNSMSTPSSEGPSDGYVAPSP